MYFKDKETLSIGIEFIIEAVAVNTAGQDRSALGLYLISLLLDDQKGDQGVKETRTAVLLDKSWTTYPDPGWKCPEF
ncbi:hypothetical protein [Vibrio tapetis]|uniref:Uncharacterized protein n=1 Tax=Vibrio tapetis subsp. tapetis TaxID=1671868 RepID=A0A2N8ZIC3_9VIBR|nr:hypothetical protein [Vibrio tapetis]SON51663.1 conserved protein of unknown function [Vibrio tapetis subsp. tapetis]